MNEAQFLIIKIFIETIGSIVLLCWVFVGWITHLIMMIELRKNKGWGNFKKFKKHYFAYGENNWTVREEYKDSLFSNSNDYKEQNNFQIHASQFIFGGNGMRICDPINFKLIQHFIKKEVKKKRQEQNINLNKKIKF